MKFNYDAYERLCREKGESPSAVAQKAGISKNLPGRWKAGTAKPSNQSIKKLAEHLEVPIKALLLDDGNVIGGEIIGSAIVQGSSGSTIKYNSPGRGEDQPESQLTEQEIELLRIFRGMDMKGKIAVLSFAYAEEERQNTK